MTKPDLDDLRRIYEHGAPKVMALLAWAEYLENVRDGLLREYETLSAREVKLREALRVYADHDFWNESDPNGAQTRRDLLDGQRESRLGDSREGTRRRQ